MGRDPKTSVQQEVITCDLCEDSMEVDSYPDYYYGEEHEEVTRGWQNSEGAEYISIDDDRIFCRKCYEAKIFSSIRAIIKQEYMKNHPDAVFISTGILPEDEHTPVISLKQPISAIAENAYRVKNRM